MKTAKQILDESAAQYPYEIMRHTGLMLLRCEHLSHYASLAEAQSVAQTQADKNGGVYIVGDRRDNRIVSKHEAK